MYNNIIFVFYDILFIVVVVHLEQATQSTLTYKDSVVSMSPGERLKIIFFVRLVTLLYSEKKNKVEQLKR